MLFNIRLGRIFSRINYGTISRRPRVSTCRPRLEALEDRCLLTAGALDPTFGNGAGYVTTTLNSPKGAVSSDFAYSALIPTDGKIRAAGYSGAFSNPPPTPSVTLVRYNPDGSLDPSFGNAGEVIGPASVGAGYIHAALYPSAGSSNDGKIVVGGLKGGVLDRPRQHQRHPGLVVRL